MNLRSKPSEVVSTEADTRPNRLAAVAAAWCCTAVGLGAFGAHALEGRLDREHLELWTTASQYLMYSGLGALALTALQVGGFQESRALAPAGWFLVIGGAVFASTLIIIALGGPRWLGAVTPLGGTAMILGFALAAGILWRRSGRRARSKS